MSVRRVYIPQAVYRIERFSVEEQAAREAYSVPEGSSPAGGKRRVPLFDLSHAEQFGEITPVLDHDDNPLFLAKITTKIKEALENFNPQEDYLLAIGDPSVLAICAGVILRRTNRFKMLKWDKRVKTYISLEINL